MEINNITTLEQLKDSIISVGIDSLPTADILLRNGWIDERYMKHGICRIGNNRLAFNKELQPVISTIDNTIRPRRSKGNGLISKNITISADPELFSILDGIANRSLFVSDAIISFRSHVSEYQRYEFRAVPNPDYRLVNVAIAEPALQVLALIRSRHKYIYNAVMAYKKYKNQYV